LAQRAGVVTQLEIFGAKSCMATAKHKLFDALIVGAGPAGSYLGYLLARQGATVGIIEKCRLPRDKICGGGVSRKALELLEFDIAPVIHRWIGGAHLRFQGRASILKNIDPPIGCTVLRRQFDYLLLEKARAAGVHVFEETPFVDVRRRPERIEVQTDRHTMHCRLMVGADGVASSVRTKAFAKQMVHYEPALEILVPLADVADSTLNDRAVFDFGALPRGYGWIFPKQGHLNVGVYSPYGARNLRKHLQVFVQNQLNVCVPPDAKVWGYPIPVRNAPGVYQADRVWLLGDAAGLADGLFGEGIYFALRSAKLAAQALHETAFEPRSKRYAQLLQRELVPELRASRWLGKALFAFPEYAYSHLVCNPRINDDFAGLISGTVGYRKCLFKTLACAPRWLL
jgi:geranylgeranyl reductase family protein